MASGGCIAHLPYHPSTLFPISIYRIWLIYVGMSNYDNHISRTCAQTLSSAQTVRLALDPQYILFSFFFFANKYILFSISSKSKTHSSHHGALGVDCCWVSSSYPESPISGQPWPLPHQLLVTSVPHPDMVLHWTWHCPWLTFLLSRFSFLILHSPRLLALYFLPLRIEFTWT
jgi:hypothetical protein